MAEVEKDRMTSTFPDNSSTRDVTTELTRPQLDSVQKPKDRLFPKWTEWSTNKHSQSDTSNSIESPLPQINSTWITHKRHTINRARIVADAIVI